MYMYEGTVQINMLLCNITTTIVHAIMTALQLLIVYIYIRNSCRLCVYVSYYIIIIIIIITITIIIIIIIIIIIM